MQRFINSVDTALAAGDWYGALSTALTLPDICGRLSNPSQTTKARYVVWFDQYILAKYTSRVGADHQLHVFLSARDCYALRCSYLHEGGDSIAEQSARDALERFHFVAPHPGSQVHMNQSNTALQLQVDLFCRDLCDGVHAWLADTAADAGVGDRMKALLTIHSLAGGFRF